MIRLISLTESRDIEALHESIPQVANATNSMTNGTFSMSDQDGIRQITNLLDSSGSSMLSTLPSRQISVALSLAHNYAATLNDKNAIFTTSAYQPLVLSNCLGNYLPLGLDPNKFYLKFGNSSAGYDTSLDNTVTFAAAFEYSVGNFSLSFHKVPDRSANNHFALVVYGFKGPQAGPSDIYLDVYIPPNVQMITAACVIDAAWVPSTQNSSNYSPTNFLLEKPMTQYLFTSDLISIPPEWSKGMTDVVKGSLNLLDDIFVTQVFPGTYIAVALSNSNEYPMTLWDMSVRDFNADFNESKKGDAEFGFEQWIGNTVHSTSMHRRGKPATVHILTTTNWTGPQQLSQQIIYAVREGYGYSYTGIPVQLSLAAIGVHCLIAFAYLVYTLSTGVAGSSWDSISELLMLGLCSPQPSHLKHVSTGIDTLSTFREPISVRVSDEDVVQLVFANDTTVDKLRYRNVEHNKAY